MVKDSMNKFMVLLITLAVLLLTACSPISNSIDGRSSPSALVPTGESTLVPTESLQPSTATAPVSPRVKPGQANADVIHVRVVLGEGGTWNFHVTISHPDTGWEDYADGWDVVTPQGTVLKVNPGDPFTRLLFHPHENEQPFTRSQGGITIPAGVTQVQVRAHDIVDGFGGQEILIDLEKTSGPGYEVER